MLLQLGDSGPEVLEVQQHLVGLGHSLALDGVFGVRTDDAVRGFQTVCGLRPDGIVGPLTRMALTEEPGLWAEVHVNVKPALSLERINRTDTSTAPPEVTTFEADVRWPGITAQMFLDPTGLSDDLADTIEALVTEQARAAEAPFAPFGPSHIRGEIEATLIAPTLIGLHGNLSVYVTGAAHPNPQVFTSVLDIAAGTVIPAADLWMPGTAWLQRLQEIALLSIAPGPGLDPTPENYKHLTVTPDGIKVVFDAFQVAPGAAGAVSFVASWDRIEAEVRPSIAARSAFHNPGGPGPHPATP